MSESKQPQAQSLRILLVDDHQASARALTRLLRYEGHAVATAYTLTGALALGGGPGTVELLLCDIDLPDGDGCDLLRRMRALHGNGLTAIAMSGYDAELMEKCAQAGFREVPAQACQARGSAGCGAALCSASVAAVAAASANEPVTAP
jgi:CheY-like chemotaxis protein